MNQLIQQGIDGIFKPWVRSVHCIRNQNIRNQTLNVIRLSKRLQDDISAFFNLFISFQDRHHGNLERRFVLQFILFKYTVKVCEKKN